MNPSKERIEVSDLLSQLISRRPSNYGAVNTLRDAEEAIPQLKERLVASLLDGSIVLSMSSEPLDPPDDAVPATIPFGIVAVLEWLAESPISEASNTLALSMLDAPWADVRGAAASVLAQTPTLALSEIKSRVEDEDTRRVESAFLLAGWMTRYRTLPADAQLKSQLGARVGDLVGEAKKYAATVVKALPGEDPGKVAKRKSAKVPEFAGVKEAVISKVVSDLAWVPAGGIGSEKRVIDGAKISHEKFGFWWFLLEHDLYWPRSLSWYGTLGSFVDERRARQLAVELTRLPVSNGGFAGLGGWSSALDSLALAAFRVSPEVLMGARSRFAPSTRIAFDFVRLRFGESIDSESRQTIVDALGRHASFGSGAIQVPRGETYEAVDAATVAQEFCSGAEWEAALDRARSWGERG
ncbi:MAG: hypothetical protein H6721_27130 [Sandaracinus sp.]|nr:hypothetical protein [Sandaracinus sp.]MCB9613847.1 hypothetical protein [Sandaracinus sp.]MCB9635808.1 hypothetical protein [Sandaracinus sp.]